MIAPTKNPAKLEVPSVVIRFLNAQNFQPNETFQRLRHVTQNSRYRMSSSKVFLTTMRDLIYQNKHSENFNTSSEKFLDILLSAPA
ncbi:hypothetical protein TNIN_255081 [Trichonephila inaurata madagascariensis]|uniref:Uncharacterized protein n=1 Tax=Trichonephila inaurata madagascariensis TaxID=2747483 RepID=A0A8X6WNI6_9ARAC|nr:hypothetical protein TNIN_255081 [Trichonephila inaurata madagascariensis]